MVVCFRGVCSDKEYTEKIGKNFYISAKLAKFSYMYTKLPQVLTEEN